MNKIGKMGIVAHLIALGAAALVTTAAARAEAAHWRGAASCLKAIAERTRQGDEFAWALNCTANGAGFNVVHSHQRLQGNGWYWEWPRDSAGASGTSITVRAGTPWVVSADHGVWWKDSASPENGGQWWSYPTNKCEGGSLTIRQVVGDTSIAVGDGNIVYVIGGNGQVRTWNGSCWAQLPTLPGGGTAREIAIWGGWPAGQRTKPWVVLNNNQFWYLNANSAWQQLPGLGVAISQNKCVDTGGAGLWRWSAPTWEPDPNAWTNGAITQVTGLWILAATGVAYNWED